MEKVTKVISSWAFVLCLFGVLFGGGLTVPARHFQASVTMFVIGTIVLACKIISLLDADEYRSAFTTIILILAAALTYWEVGYARGEIQIPGLERPPVYTVYPAPEQPKSAPKIETPKPDQPKPRPKAKPQPEKDTPVIPIVPESHYGNLAFRCKKMGDDMVAYADASDNERPNPVTDREAYYEWIKTTDAKMRALGRRDIDELQKDLAANTIRDPELDERLNDWREVFKYRNGPNMEMCLSNPANSSCYTQTYDIRKMGELFQRLATTIPKT